MKILFINPYLPLPLTSGDNVRSFSLMSSVSKVFQITAVVYSNHMQSPQLDALQQFCESYYQIQQKKDVFGCLNFLQSASLPHPFRCLRQRKMVRLIHYLLQNQKFDLIHCGHVAVLPLISKRHTIPVVLQQDTLHPPTLIAQINPSKVNGKYQARVKAFLHQSWQRVEAIIVPTAAMQESVLQAVPKARVEVVPHGVDGKYFASCRYLKSEKTLIILGAMDRPSNITGALYFVRHIWPLLRRMDSEVRLFIVGRKPAREVLQLNRHRDVHVTGEVVDIRPFLGSATVAVFPQQQPENAGVAILEAMSMGAAIVSSPQACSGLDVQENIHLRMAKTPQVFAQIIYDLLQSPQERTRLGMTAREFTQKHHRWEAVTERLIAVYQSLAGRLQEQEGVPSVIIPPEESLAPRRPTNFAETKAMNEIVANTHHA